MRSIFAFGDRYIEKNGFELVKFSYEFGSIKKKWVDKFPYGNGFFILNHDDSYDG